MLCFSKEWEAIEAFEQGYGDVIQAVLWKNESLNRGLRWSGGRGETVVQETVQNSLIKNYNEGRDQKSGDGGGVKGWRFRATVEVEFTKSWRILGDSKKSKTKDSIAV